MSATMPKICRHPDGTDNCDCGGLTGEVCRWVKIIADEQADWDRREKVEYLTAERIRLKRRIGELEEQLRAAQPAPISGLEPVAWRFAKRSVWHVTSEHGWADVHGDCVEPLYTAAQLEAHAAAEREVCLALALEHDDPVLIAAAIRARGQV